MDEFLSIALWIIIAFMVTSAAVTWFTSQTDITQFNLGLKGYQKVNADVSVYQSSTCTMTSLVDLPAYAFCFIGKITTPIIGDGVNPGIIGYIWNLLTNWTNLINAIFGCTTTLGTTTCLVPGGTLFTGILIPFLGFVELGAATLLLMRLAVIIRGSGAIGI